MLVFSGMAEDLQVLRCLCSYRSGEEGAKLEKNYEVIAVLPLLSLCFLVQDQDLTVLSDV